MVIPLTELVAHLDAYLRLPGCQDSSHNGLQVEGRPTVRKIVAGVDASLELFERAAAAAADLVLVHHGLSWKDSLKQLRGLTARRLELLFSNGISLYASHLPLDAHPEAGNNARLADRLGLAGRRPFFTYGGVPIGVVGTLPRPLTAPELAARLERELATRCLVIPGRAGELRTLGVVSGGAGDAAEEAAAAGCDALVTGEITHSHIHLFRETGLTGIAAGHYATETLGVRALLERLTRTFALPGEFIDLPTGL
ncbi:MAG: Nif3-like dinuclear metal center hexameric protein [Lentisphaeria bacterium]|jgi:dinuclear metal center YbgI/SA1388 family protein